MRQLKFRGRSLTNGHWVYGDSIKHTENASENSIEVLTYIGERVPNARKVGAMKWVPVDHSTVGQFTGLRDCDGKEIYEGDIVRISVSPTIETQETNNRNAKLMGFKMPSWLNGGDTIARISFFDTAFHFITISSYLPDFEGKQEPILHYLFNDRHPDHTPSYTQEIAVIGNIHDYPELMK